MRKTRARILFFDIEVSRDIVGGYGKKYDFRVVKTYRHQELMCFAYKYSGDKKTSYISRHDFGTYREFIEVLWTLLDKAGREHVPVVAHNGNGFDNKMANRFFVKEGFGPVAPYKSIDTLQIARREFKFQSNSLNDLCEYLNIGEKKKITYADIEDQFLDNPTPKIERLMELYNKHDVVLLEKLYYRFLPFIRNHPNMGDMTQTDGVCPKCLSPNITPYGSSRRRNGLVRAYRCDDCGGRSNDNTIKKTGGRLVNA